jgi:hypothetical protein
MRENAGEAAPAMMRKKHHLTKYDALDTSLVDS